MMRKHQLKLADRQCRMAELSGRVQNLIIVLATCLHAARKDEVVQQAADVLAMQMRREHEFRRPTDREYRAVTKLGETIVDGGFKSIAGLPTEEIMMPY